MASRMAMSEGSIGDRCVVLDPKRARLWCTTVAYQERRKKREDAGLGFKLDGPGSLRFGPDYTQ